VAWSFQLSIECGKQQNAEGVAQHFDLVSWKLADGSTSTCGAYLHRDAEGNWWTIVCPSGVSRSCVSSEQAALSAF